MRDMARASSAALMVAFPFLFGGTFIEGSTAQEFLNFTFPFPFLFGGTFIEGATRREACTWSKAFPFLFGGTFIEGGSLS